MRTERHGPVAVICPMDMEFMQLYSALEDIKEETVAGYRFCLGKCGTLPVLLIRCLIGSVNAAVCAVLAIERYAPRCVILQGTSGAHNPELRKNDIVVAETIVSLQSYMSERHAKGEGIHPTEWKDLGTQTYMKNTGTTDFQKVFLCDRMLFETALSVPYEQGKVIAGTVGAGDGWNREADMICLHRAGKGTDCEAMEGVGVAQVCASFGVPMVEIRVISNCELRDGEEFSEDTARNGQTFVFDFLKLLAKL